MDSRRDSYCQKLKQENQLQKEKTVIVKLETPAMYQNRIYHLSSPEFSLQKKASLVFRKCNKLWMLVGLYLKIKVHHTETYTTSELCVCVCVRAWCVRACVCVYSYAIM